MTITQTYQSRVYNTARNCGLNDVQAKIITAQASHESGNFKSNVFKTDNNIFGMKVPNVRPKTYIASASAIVRNSEGSTPYAHYSSMEDSVKDLLLGWHKYNRTDWTAIQTPEQYATYLKSKGYYGDSLTNYLAALKKYVSGFDFLKVATSPILIFAFIGTAIYFLTTK